MNTQNPANKTVSTRIPRGEARTRLLDTALKLIRQHGFAGTSVDALCKEAGVTKGAFFHHFESKEALGVAAADYWSETTSALFASAPYHAPEDPLARVYAYLDFRRALVEGETYDFTCLAGTMVQEIFETGPQIREACQRSIAGHTATIEPLMQAAMDARGVGAPFTASGLALLIQTVLQGGFITSKAQGGPEPVLDALAHLKRYFTFIFEGIATPATTRSAA